MHEKYLLTFVHFLPPDMNLRSASAPSYFCHPVELRGGSKSSLIQASKVHEGKQYLLNVFLKQPTKAALNQNWPQRSVGGFSQQLRISKQGADCVEKNETLEEILVRPFLTF